MHRKATAYVGLGSNEGDAIAQVRAAMAALAQLPQTTVIRCSSIYRTAPVGFVAQPDFMNAVCALSTELAPETLMQALLAIERANGRIRNEAQPGGPRTLDLDLLLYDDLVMQSESLTLPHPRLHERAFVLVPLNEIAPDLVVPGHSTVQALQSVVSNQAVRRV